MDTPVRFIIIDDDRVNNFICKQVIIELVGNVEINTFADPEEGFNYLTKNSSIDPYTTTILFLDINMPSLSGWEFLERLEQHNDGNMSKTKIYMLSSSVNENDILRARSNTLICDYVVKPLNEEFVKNILQTFPLEMK